MSRILTPGKVPNELLEQLLRYADTSDPSILVGPGVGEDTAVISAYGGINSAGDFLLLKTDPVTFAGDRIGYYAVHVNANDIAASGGTAKWFLASLLLPLCTRVDQIRKILDDIAAAAHELGMSICGGHTEITEAVIRPVVCGMTVGTAAPEHLKRKSDIRPGQNIIMTKSAGFEGTAILAREYGERLAGKGVSKDAISRGADFLDHISILPEARIACVHPGVTAMHDITEGGAATALREIVAPSGWGLEINIENIMIDRITSEFCEAVQIDPLGLIGSGSLLIACAEDETSVLVRALNAAEIPAREVGTVTTSGGVSARSGVLPVFDVDEITRL
ncbi:MAG: hypothetical protein HN368_01765 [Spirochaetales bacterium]|nr:hypothetical protein [Spirochaetales bacterium]